MPIPSPLSTIRKAGVERRLDARGRDSFTTTSFAATDSPRAAELDTLSGP
jgi:hypothetical protein